MTENCNKRRRITVKYKSPNPLFERWLNEWIGEAKAKSSKLEGTYKKALLSLKKCPIIFNSGQECKILKGFGDHLCKLLDQRLEEHKSQMSEIQSIDSNNLEEALVMTKNWKKRKMLPKELEKTQELECKSIDFINDSELLIKDNPKNKLRNANESEQSQDYLKEIIVEDKFQFESKTVSLYTEQSNDSNKTGHNQASDTDYFIFEPGTFDTILLVDTAETGPTDPLLNELHKLPEVCLYEVRKLNVGDYAWICRDRTTKRELILPYIFERKRLDDFASSIKDGRYKEQKFRLKRSGIEKRYYLIENCQKHVGLPVSTLQQAAINTAIHDGFKIKVTCNLNHTAQYLNKFTSLLIQTMKNKTLIRCLKEDVGPVNLSDDLVSLMSFKEFNQDVMKNKPLKVTDLFIKMLIQIKGMSVQKAIAITENYPSPILLRKAISEFGVDLIQKSISEFTYESQKVGISLSRTVVQLFTLEKN